MDIAQATKIHRRLLALEKALSSVNKALRELSAIDRAPFSEPMATVWYQLHGKALRLIYKRYPELEPIPADFDLIDSDLQWKDVTLPQGISAAELDAVILSQLKPRSLKVAKIVGDVRDILEERGHPIDLDVISARI